MTLHMIELYRQLIASMVNACLVQQPYVHQIMQSTVIIMTFINL